MDKRLLSYLKRAARDVFEQATQVWFSKRSETMPAWLGASWWARRSESDPLAARKLIHLRA